MTGLVPVIHVEPSGSVGRGQGVSVFDSRPASSDGPTWMAGTEAGHDGWEVS
jgi:hypothetical protein